MIFVIKTDEPLALAKATEKTLKTNFKIDTICLAPDPNPRNNTAIFVTEFYPLYPAVDVAMVAREIIGVEAREEFLQTLLEYRNSVVDQAKWLRRTYEYHNFYVNREPRDGYGTVIKKYLCPTKFVATSPFFSKIENKFYSEVEAHTTTQTILP